MALFKTLDLISSHVALHLGGVKLHICIPSKRVATYQYHHHHHHHNHQHHYIHHKPHHHHHHPHQYFIIIIIIISSSIIINISSPSSTPSSPSIFHHHHQHQAKENCHLHADPSQKGTARSSMQRVPFTSSKPGQYDWQK